jgi:EAL domain-containing protein (putative c-di-GMP-specific phosphodiesterase class I)
LQEALYLAIEKQEFVLYFQPILDIQHNKIMGLEAFLHWRRQGRMLDPDEFIPFSEETGLIVPMGEWVIRNACEKLKAWHQLDPDLIISLNLSYNQIVSGNLADTIKNITEEVGISSSFIELEITEKKLLRSLEISTTLMNTLKKMDVRIAIDDFGTGYSSLAYLKRFNTDAIKIDRSFIKDLPNNLKAAVSVKAIIDMAKSLGLITIAVGVETKEQYEFLRAAGCNQIQGYYFCHPLPLKEITQFLQSPLNLK